MRFISNDIDYKLVENARYKAKAVDYKDYVIVRTLHVRPTMTYLRNVKVSEFLLDRFLFRCCSTDRLFSLGSLAYPIQEVRHNRIN